MGKVLLQAAKDPFKRQLVDFSRDPGTLPPIPAKDPFEAQLVDSP
jgi:hypothetical protein